MTERCARLEHALKHYASIDREHERRRLLMEEGQTILLARLSTAHFDIHALQGEVLRKDKSIQSLDRFLDTQRSILSNAGTLQTDLQREIRRREDTEVALADQHRIIAQVQEEKAGIRKRVIFLEEQIRTYFEEGTNTEVSLDQVLSSDNVPTHITYAEHKVAIAALELDNVTLRRTKNLQAETISLLEKQVKELHSMCTRVQITGTTSPVPTPEADYYGTDYHDVRSEASAPSGLL